jgi:hypothetical protein
MRRQSIQLAQAPRVRPIFWWLLGGAVVMFILAKKRADEEEVRSVESVEETAKDVIAQIEAGTARGDVVNQLYRAISAELPTLPRTSKLLMIAQAITESGWAKGRAALNANNWWNITSGSAWTGDVFVDVNGDRSYTASNCKRVGRPMSFKDSKGRAYCKIDQKWRKYPTINDAVRDYWAFLGPNQNRGRYVTARGLLESGNVEGFVRELRKAGYYDAPVETYLRLVTSIVSSLPKYLSA